jgi:hypothetical protein
MVAVVGMMMPELLKECLLIQFLIKDRLGGITTENDTHMRGC